MDFYLMVVVDMIMGIMVISTTIMIVNLIVYLKISYRLSS